MRSSLILFFTVLATSGFCQSASQNVNLLYNWDDTSVPAEPFYGIRYNSVWGYAANGREYAILGASTGTYFIDVTDPTAPVEIAFVPGRRDNTIWREYKTYGNYAYLVSDDSPPNSLQIVDLSDLPTKVKLVYDSDSIFSQAHTIYVEGNLLYGGAVKTKDGTQHSMAVYDLANPEKPKLLRALEQDYPNIGHVHDMMVTNDTIFASCGYDGLHMYAFDGNIFVEIGSLTSYPDQGYNHSSDITEDRKHLVFCDEVPENLAVKVINIEDFNNIQIASTFKSNEGATAHNPYIRGNRLIVAYYKDGVQIYDISDPANPIRTGFYDTHPQNGNSYTGTAYAGNWGAYPWLPSGNLLVSDMQKGLFILDASAALGIIKPDLKPGSLGVFPNPFKDQIKISGYGKAQIDIYDVAGRQILSQSKSLPCLIPTSTLPEGVYIVKVVTEDSRFTQKMLK